MDEYRSMSFFNLVLKVHLSHHSHIHSERPLQKLLCGPRDWAAFTLCFAQRGTRNVLGDIARPAFDGIEGNHPEWLRILTA